MNSEKIPMTNRPLPNAPAEYNFGMPPPSYNQTHPEVNQPDDNYAQVDPHWISNHSATHPTRPFCSFANITRVALTQLLLGLICLASGTFLTTSTYPPRIYAGLWVSALFLTAGICGTVASKCGRTNHRWLIAYLVLSVLLVVGSCVLAIFSMLNWADAGTIAPLPNCVVPIHDPSRPEVNRIVKKIYHNTEFDFALCLQTFKLAIGVNSVLFVMAVIEAILGILSFILCCKQLCGDRRHPVSV